MVLTLKLSVFSKLTNGNLCSVPIRQVDSIYRTRAKKDEMRKSLSKPQLEFKSLCIKLMLFKTFLFQILPTNNDVGDLSDSLYYKYKGISSGWLVFSWIRRHSTTSVQHIASSLGHVWSGSRLVTLSSESKLVSAREALQGRCFNPCFVIAQGASSNGPASRFHYRGGRASQDRPGQIQSSLKKQHRCLCSVIPRAFGLWRA